MDKVYQAKDVPAELDKPTFDFSNVSYKSEREGARLQMRIEHVSKRMAAADAETDVESLIAEFDELVDRRDALIFAAIESMPQSWLIRTAPPTESINWQDPDSKQWLRADKLQATATAKNIAQNSIGPN